MSKTVRLGRWAPRVGVNASGTYSYMTLAGDGGYVRAKDSQDTIDRLEARVAELEKQLPDISETYYTQGKNADWFDNLSDEEFVKYTSYAAMDIADGNFGVVESFVPVVAILSIAAERIRKLLWKLKS